MVVPMQRESNVFDAKMSDRVVLVNGPEVDAVPRDPTRVWHRIMRWAPENGISPQAGANIWILSGSTSSCRFGCSRVSGSTCLCLCRLHLSVAFREHLLDPLRPRH